MKDIKDLFAVMYRWRVRDAADRLIVKEVMRGKAGIDVPEGSINFKGRTIALSGVGQAAKSQIFIKKRALLEEIAARLPHRKISDIR